jgi:hypothetical protein
MLMMMAGGDVILPELDTCTSVVYSEQDNFPVATRYRLVKNIFSYSNYTVSTIILSQFTDADTACWITDYCHILYVC